MRLVLKAVGWTEKASAFVGHISSVCLVGLFGLMFVGVILRYVFNAPIPAGDEISAYLVVGIAYLAAASALREDKHITVDVLFLKFSPKTRDRITVVMYVLLTMVVVLVWWYSVKVVQKSYTGNIKSWSILMTPIFIPQLAIPIGMFFLLLQTVASGLRRVQRLGKK